MTHGIRTDASPWGMGGVLFDFASGAILGYWADALSEDDLARFGATKGDPAFQTEWELLAVVVSLAIWEKKLSNRKIAVQSDNTATLSTAPTSRAARPS